MFAQKRGPTHNIITHLLSPYYVPDPELDAFYLNYFI